MAVGLPRRRGLGGCGGCPAPGDLLGLRIVAAGVGRADGSAAAAAGRAAQPGRPGAGRLAGSSRRAPSSADGGRALLWAAAVTGLMLAASRLVGIPPLSERISAHAGRELAALEAALAVGFTLAAWRPGRHAGGLLWVAVTAAGLTLLGSGADLLTGRSHIGGEVAHLPLLAGALGLLLTRPSRPRRMARMAPAT